MSKFLNLALGSIKEKLELICLHCETDECGKCQAPCKNCNAHYAARDALKMIEDLPKYTINLGDCVKIKPLEDMDGRVVDILISKRGAEYKVRYFADSTDNEVYFYEDELEKT